MKKTILLAFMALAIVAVPATAQTRKDRKAAEKAKWEQQQQFDAEEAALRHQIRMDSIANAKREAEEQAAARAAKAAADKAAAEAKAKAQAEAIAAQEVIITEPCEEYYSTKELIRGRGVAEAPIQQVAMAQARTLAVQEFASQIKSTVNAVASNEMAGLSDGDFTEVQVMYNDKVEKPQHANIGHQPDTGQRHLHNGMVHPRNREVAGLGTSCPKKGWRESSFIQVV